MRDGASFKDRNCHIVRKDQRGTKNNYVLEIFAKRMLARIAEDLPRDIKSRPALCGPRKQDLGGCP